MIRGGAVCLAVSLLAASAEAQLIKLTEADEIEIGRQASLEIEKSQQPLDSKPLAEYLERLGKKLAGTSSRAALPWQFKTLNLDAVNAFALPGGFIYMHRGLIEAAGTEAELAGVLAHEVAHVAARHHVADLQRRMVGALGAQILGGIFGSKGNAATIGKIGADLAASGAFMKFSREAEREADRIGARLMHDAGYDPKGMVSLFEKLAKLRESQPNAVQQFFSSHPDPKERSANIADLLKGFDKRQYAGEARDFAEVRKAVSELPRPAVAVAPPPPADAIGPFDVVGQHGGEARDHRIAAALAPIFHQGIGTEPRYDWIGHYSFDGDWRGDNNWANAANPEYSIQAWIFYAVRETPTHFFAHYGVFHPRDYKGGSQRGSILSDVIREGVKIGGQYDPTGRAEEAVLAHENDMEGALVVAEKSGPEPENARVVFVETLAHNKFFQYRPQAILMEGNRARLFIEPKGHGIEAWTGSPEQIKGCTGGVLEYTFADGASQPAPGDKTATYGLMPLWGTLWKIAHDPANDTFGVSHDYGYITVRVQLANGQVKEQAIKIGTAGSGFLGKVGGNGLARPPWGWFDASEKDRPLGEWFFQPAETIQRHFKLGDSFSTVYLHTRF